MSVAFADDRWIPLEEIAARVQKSVLTVREIAQAQNGIFKKPRCSEANQRTYPPMKKGPGGKYGCWLSEFERWREDDVFAQRRVQ